MTHKIQMDDSLEGEREPQDEAPLATYGRILERLEAIDAKLEQTAADQRKIERRLSLIEAKTGLR